MGGGDRILVGDVGGTHARFAIIDVSGSAPRRIGNRLDLEEKFPTFGAALQSYIERCRVLTVPTAAVIAVA